MEFDKLTIEQAEIFAQAVQAADEIIQAAITALEQLAETIRVALAPMAASMRAFVRRLEREIVRCWHQQRRYLPITPSHTRHAMRARKIQRYCQAITA